MALALIGLYVFHLKRTNLLVYARVEIAFAMTSCYVAFDKLREGLTITVLTVFAAAIYIVVSGLENRRKALDERETERASSLRFR